MAIENNSIFSSNIIKTSIFEFSPYHLYIYIYTHNIAFLAFVMFARPFHISDCCGLLQWISPLPNLAVTKTLVRFLYVIIYYIWVNFITTSLFSLTGIMVNKRNHPQMGQQFRLVKYYNLPRLYTLYPLVMMAGWNILNGGFDVSSITKVRGCAQRNAERAFVGEEKKGQWSAIPFIWDIFLFFNHCYSDL